MTDVFEPNWIAAWNEPTNTIPKLYWVILRSVNAGSYTESQIAWWVPARMVGTFSNFSGNGFWALSSDWDDAVADYDLEVVAYSPIPVPSNPSVPSDWNR